jgi:hypothetical protein
MIICKFIINFIIVFITIESFHLQYFLFNFSKKRVLYLNITARILWSGKGKMLYNTVFCKKNKIMRYVLGMQKFPFLLNM